MSSVPAHWDAINRAVAIRDRLNPNVLILGNGDAKDIPDAQIKAEETGADGIMLGRAIFGNPWLFNPEGAPALPERLVVMVEHTKLFEELLPHKNFAIMKKHYKAYIAGFEGVSELRSELMNAPDAAGVESIVHTFLHKSLK